MIDNNINLGWYYYRDYFQGISLVEKDLSDVNTEKLFKQKNSDFVNIKPVISDLSNPAHEQTLFMETTYPGLLLGAGYVHEVSAKGELKLGFFFDHTTGLPILPGSSVKGVLRSAFPNYKRHEKSSEEVKWVKTCFIEALLTNKTTEDVYSELEGNEEAKKALIDKITKLENAIFDGIKDIEKPDPKDKYYGIYERDIFFDAFILKANENYKVLGIDSITPHIKEGMTYESAMLKNPVPIPFLKVLPKVVFCFQFRLQESAGLSAENKLALFNQILLSKGIGAKTNVGYGQLKTATSLNTKQGEKQLQDEAQSEQKETPKTAISMKAMEKFKAGLHKAVLVAEEDGYYILKLYDCTLVKSVNGFKKKTEEMAEKRAKKGKSGEYKAFVIGGEIMVDIKENFRYNSENHYPFSLVPVWE